MHLFHTFKSTGFQLTGSGKSTSSTSGDGGGAGDVVKREFPLSTLSDVILGALASNILISSYFLQVNVPNSAPHNPCRYVLQKDVKDPEIHIAVLPGSAARAVEQALEVLVEGRKGTRAAA